MDIVCQNCGLVNDYKVIETNHLTAYCNGCNRYIKHLPKPNKELVIYFGKYKGTALKDFTSKEHVSWLNWALLNTTNFKASDIELINKHLKGY
jgi:hypothetical protein